MLTNLCELHINPDNDMVWIGSNEKHLTLPMMMYVGRATHTAVPYGLMPGVSITNSERTELYAIASKLGSGPPFVRKS